MKNLFKILMCSAVFFLAAACSKDSTGDDSSTTGGGITYKSCSDTEEVSAEAQNVTVTITSEGAWSAKSSATRIASIKEGTESGEAGTHDIILEFTANTTDFNRNVTLSVTVGGKTITLCRFTQLSESLKGTDANVNKNYTTPILDEYYLWNEDFRELTLDYNQAYDDFVNNTLSSMTTNILDGHWENGKRQYIYSYIQRYSASSASAALAEFTRAGKTPVSGYGFYAEPAILDYSGSYYFLINWVYPDSPAAVAGLKRGDIIGKVNGTVINESNVENIFYDYFYYYPTVGTKTTFSICDYDFNTSKPSYGADADVELTATSYYETPVIYSTVFSSKEDPSIKIGYMVYNSFESEYDDDVAKVFETFREDGINNIILDLRYNGGGAVSSARMIASALAGANGGTSGNEKVFEYYRRNDERMEKMGLDKDNYETYESEPFDVSVATKYGFNLDNIYVIATVNTASASELIINSLRGIDVPVKIVGTTTNGKNVGMEVMSFGPVDGYTYVFAPISFQSYNAKGESNYSNGFEPDVLADYSMYVPNDWGLNEPMLGEALNDLLKSKTTSKVKQTIQANKRCFTPVKMKHSRFDNPLRNNMFMVLDEPVKE